MLAAATAAAAAAARRTASRRCGTYLVASAAPSAAAAAAATPSAAAVWRATSTATPSADGGAAPTYGMPPTWSVTSSPASSSAAAPKAGVWLPWGLTPQYAAALPPVLVAALDRAVLQGLLNRPTWQRNDVLAQARTFADFQQTPRDGFVFDVAMAATMKGAVAPTAAPAAAAEGGDVPPAIAAAADVPALRTALAAAPAAAAPTFEGTDASMLASPHSAAFLAAATDVFHTLFGGGAAGFARAAGVGSGGRDEEAHGVYTELLHPTLAEAIAGRNAGNTAQPVGSPPLRSRVPATTTADQIGSTACHVVGARVVDFHGVWDGTMRASDLADNNYRARELGHTIAVESKHPGGAITRIMHSLFHTFQLQPVRRVVARATVAFLCLEHDGTRLLGTPFELPAVASTAAADDEATPAASRGRRRVGRASPSGGGSGGSGDTTSAHDDGEPHPPSVNPLLEARIASQFAPSLATRLRAVVRASGPHVSSATAGSGGAGGVGAAAEAIGVDRAALDGAAAAADVPAAAGSPALTVHTLALECVAEDESDPSFKPLRYLRAPRLVATHGWRVVDVDGHFAEAGYTFSTVTQAAHAKAEDRSRFEMGNVVENSLPGGVSTCRVLGGLSRHLEALSASSGRLARDLRGSRYGDGVLATPLVNADAPLGDALALVTELVSYAARYAGEVGAVPVQPPWQRRVALERALEAAAAESAAPVAGGAAPRAPAFISAGSAIVGGRYLLEPRADIASLLASLQRAALLAGDVPVALRLQLQLMHRGFVNFNEVVQLSYMTEMVTHIAIPALYYTAAAATAAVQHGGVKLEAGTPAATRLTAIGTRLTELAESISDTRLFQVAMVTVAEQFSGTGSGSGGSSASVSGKRGSKESEGSEGGSSGRGGDDDAYHAIATRRDAMYTNLTAVVTDLADLVAELRAGGQLDGEFRMRAPEK